MKTISEFIQEQETGVSLGTDNLVAAYCECAAAMSLAQCYTEQAAIIEFAVENDVNYLNIVQEAENKENIFKRAGKAIENAWEKVLDFFRAIARKISGMIADKRYEAITKSIKDVPSDTNLKGVASKVLTFPKFINLFNDTVEQFYQDINNDINVVSGESGAHTFKAVRALTDFLEKNKEDYGSAGPITAGAIKERFDTDFSKGRIQEVLKRLDKKIGEIEKAIKNNKKKPDKDFNAGEQSRMNEYVKKIVDLTTKGYDIAIKDFNDGYASLKSAIDDAKKETKSTNESFYFV